MDSKQKHPSMQWASDSDMQEIKTLLREGDLPFEDINPEIQKFRVLKTDGRITAIGGIEIYDSEALFRSFVVDKLSRNKGIGTLIYQDTINAAITEFNICAFYLLTTTAKGFFQKKGWITINRGAVPRDIQKSREFASICPASADCMMLIASQGAMNNSFVTFDRGYNCAQSVLSSFCEQEGIIKDKTLALAAGFGGGLAYSGSICGAVSGAYMTLGLRYCQTSYDENTKEMLYQKIREFDNYFLQRHPSNKCSELLNGDISKPEELEALIQNNAFTQSCPVFVCSAALILDKILNKNSKNVKS